MNTDQKILRLEQLWKNNSMNVVVYQSRYHAYRSFNGSKTTMHRLQSITKCKTTPYCEVFIDSRMFGNLKNYLAIDSYERRYICANCTSCHAIKGGEKSRDIIGPHKGNRNK